MVTNRGMTRRRPWSKICSPMSSSFWLMQAQRPESLAFALLISISAERKYAIYQLPSIKYIWEGKGRIFWEGHKNLSHPPLYFDVKYSVASNKKWKISQIFVAFTEYLKFHNFWIVFKYFWNFWKILVAPTFINFFQFFLVWLESKVNKTGLTIKVKFGSICPLTLPHLFWSNSWYPWQIKRIYFHSGE